MNDLRFDHVLDARALSCPMPLVKARQEISKLAAEWVVTQIRKADSSVYSAPWLRLSDRRATMNVALGNQELGADPFTGSFVSPRTR
ncbi:MAG: sulfurtransferase TusA family protein [Acidobacteria bacterium]|nr:sulfurtransferase TusA family protein [Acidobacteriota bacterium]